MSLRFHGLDGLRGIAALSVIFFHCSDMFHAGPVLMHGYLAVDVFFLLSGFVIALNYEPRFRSGLSFVAFAVRRGRRLLPVYWMGLIVCVAVAAYRLHPGSGFLLPLCMGAIFLPQLSGVGYAFPFNPATWSLFSEWFANLTYACGLFRLRTRTLFMLALALYAVSQTFYAMGWRFIDSSPDLLRTGCPRALGEFCLGVCICRIRLSVFLQRMPVIAPEILYCIWLVLAVVPAYGPTPLYDAFVAVFCAPLLIALLIRSEARAPQWCDAVGRLSYPLYASHLAVIMLARQYLHRPDPKIAGLVVVATIALAWVIAGLDDRLRAVLRRTEASSAVTHPAQ